ncbi:MAG TPA: trigger factor [Candidatus Paceibacterota bacterium]|nr:trigger factor [Candidatus Paceibacterota bacterium]HPT18046.1 trigger factor [Candidatus Paceibacterota bacterium]
MTKINIKKLPKSEIEIEGEIEANVFESYFEKALKKLGETVEIDGFRKGKVPENVLLSKIPEIQVLEEMAEMALFEYYPKMVEEEKIEPISRPEISITKIARKSPLGFKIKTAVMPELKLPDYKKTSKDILSKLTDKEKSTEVTDKEVEDTILDIRKSRAPKVHMADLNKDKEEHVHDENCKHDEKEEGKDGEKEKEIELPEFNNEFVQALGPFKDTEDFKAKLKENIKLEKINQIKEKTRLKIVEKIIEETEVEMPEILIDVELDKIIYRMESDITNMGLKFEEYLKHINKTIEDIRKEFRKDAEKKAKLGLVLNEISKIEKITADPEQVANEVAMILEHYKEADPERAQMHAENVLTNEAVFKFLEEQK